MCSNRCIISVDAHLLTTNNLLPSLLDNTLLHNCLIRISTDVLELNRVEVSVTCDDLNFLVVVGRTSIGSNHSLLEVCVVEVRARVVSLS